MVRFPPIQLPKKLDKLALFNETNNLGVSRFSQGWLIALQIVTKQPAKQIPGEIPKFYTCC